MDPVITWILRTGIAALMATAAFHKASDLAAFTGTVRDYRLVAERLAGPLALSFVALEVGLTIALLLPAAGGLAAVGCAFLLAVYSAAIAVNLGRGRRHIDCGCLGPRHRRPISRGLLVRNAALVAGCLLAALPAGARVLTWVDGVSIVGGLLVLSLLFHATNALAVGWNQLRRTA
jgi:hypothetical protein